jgi:hypothetical protein
LQDRPPFQLRAITYNDEAVSWSKNNHLMGNRLLPSSDNRDNIFFGTSGNIWAELMINHNICTMGLLSYAYLCPCPQFLKVAEDELSVYSASSQCDKPPFSVFTTPLYLVASGQTWYMETQEFGPLVQNSSFS